MDKDAAGGVAVYTGSGCGRWSVLVHHEYARDNVRGVDMSIQLDLEATYDNVDVAEAAKIALQLRDAGMPDDMINETLEHYKNKKGPDDHE